MNDKRKKIAQRFSNEINVSLKMSYNENCSYHLFWIRVKNRNKFMKEMLKNGIETGIHYHPIHKMQYYKTKYQLPITEQVGNEIVSLPIHPNLSESNVEKIIKLTNRFA